MSDLSTASWLTRRMEAEDANKKDTEHNEGVADDAMDVDRVLKSAGEEEVAREPMAVDAC